jgi:hypothetical protein
VYIDGRFQNTRESSKIQLSAGEHTVRLVRCGYKTWEEKITVAQGMVVALKPVLDKI